jgi:hypothetical protein
MGSYSKAVSAFQNLKMAYEKIKDRKKSLEK